MTAITQRIMTALQSSAVSRRLDTAVATATGDLPTPGSWWQGRWLGHALHPVLTDLPLGAFASASVLDLAGGHRSRPAAALLVGTGLAASAPAVVSGFAEWRSLEGPDRRVATVHATANTAALGLMAASLVARGLQLHGTGARLTLLGNLVAGASGYLGGHLALNRATGRRMDPTPDEAERDLAGALVP